VEASLSQNFTETMAALAGRRHLTAPQMAGAMREIMAGGWDDDQIAAFLVGLRAKGETAEEIAAAAGVLRENMVRLETGREDILDTCGTGGDGTGTFNISTAAALVAAGAGVPVVKHGNRAASSRCGSADVLTALGVTIEGDASWAKHCLDQAGLAFCFAPRFHPALKRVAEVRRRLGVRTLFNCLGPLANPAGAAYQLLGVGHPEMLEPLAGALCRLGTRHALLVCGRDGLDEVSLSGPTQVLEVKQGRINAWDWTPDDFDLPPCTLDDLRVDSAQESAAMIQGVLEGEDGPCSHIVLANAAAALMAAERARTPKEGVKLAADAIRNGLAQKVLQQLVACSQQV
jgi:anthranilate phosphoribosyltransferase